MSRQRLIERLEQEWQALLRTWEGLPDDLLLEPGAVGQWSVRDVLAHIATWEGEFLKAAPIILEDKPLPRYGGIDAFNAREQERKHDLSLEEVRQELTPSHQRLLDRLAVLPYHPGRVEQRLRRRLRLDTYGHYREHAAHIAAWRAARLQT